MPLPFVDRPPTDTEFEKFRLILSTFQDGTGQIARPDRTLPGWRDFERTVAITFDGVAVESKAIFDVLIPDPDRLGVQFGISCKMRGLLRDTLNKGRLTLEVSNALNDFWTAIGSYGLHQGNYQTAPDDAGKAIIDLVESWKSAAALERGGRIDLAKSSYLVLSWDEKTGRYHLSQLPLKLPPPENFSWVVEGKRLKGAMSDGKKDRVVFEWYGHAGGQLKYYPLVEECTWTSDLFELEPLPATNHMAQVVISKAIQYFPVRWKAIDLEKK